MITIRALSFLVLVINCQLIYARESNNSGKKEPGFLGMQFNPDTSPTPRDHQQNSFPQFSPQQTSSNPEVSPPTTKERNDAKSEQAFPQSGSSSRISSQQTSSLSEKLANSKQNNFYQPDAPNYSTSDNRNPIRRQTTTPVPAPIAKECYKSLREWKKDQNKRLNKIINYLQSKRGNSIIFEWRLQKSIYNSFWSILPDGMQLYILRQKELSILSMISESVSEPCCYSNVFYDCAYPPKNSTSVRPSDSN